MAQGGGGPLVQVLGPMPETGGPLWLVTRGPEGGRGMAGPPGPPGPGPPALSWSGRWRALTIPTGIEPASRETRRQIPQNYFETEIVTEQGSMAELTFWVWGIVCLFA